LDLPDQTKEYVIKTADFLAVFATFLVTIPLCISVWFLQSEIQAAPD
jgi:hypothetical protein